MSIADVSFAGFVEEKRDRASFTWARFTGRERVPIPPAYLYIRLALGIDRVIEGDNARGNAGQLEIMCMIYSLEELPSD